MVFGRSRATRNAGLATVEMAIVVMLLIVLLFGILEFGLLIKDYLGINQAAREGARIAVVGFPLATIDARVDGSAPTIDTSQMSRTYEYRTLSGASWSDWMVLTDVGSGSDTHNSAPVGAQVRVSVTYPHEFVTGPLFARVADDPQAETLTKTLWARMIMRRE